MNVMKSDLDAKMFKNSLLRYISRKIHYEFCIIKKI